MGNTKKADDSFIRRGLSELANKKDGRLHVFKAEDGSFRYELDPPKYLLDAVAMAAKGDAKPIQDVFERHGFFPDAAALLAERVTKRGRGRPLVATVEQLYEERLKQIKKELRRKGATGHVHQEAIEILEAEDRSCRAWATRTGIAVPEVDWGTLDNRRRRSKQPRKK